MSARRWKPVTICGIRCICCAFRMSRETKTRHLDCRTRNPNEGYQAYPARDTIKFHLSLCSHKIYSLYNDCSLSMAHSSSVSRFKLILGTLSFNKQSFQNGQVKKEKKKSTQGRLWTLDLWNKYRPLLLTQSTRVLEKLRVLLFYQSRLFWYHSWKSTCI